MTIPQPNPPPATSSPTPVPVPVPTPKQQYHGNCHCGAFRFAISIPALTRVGSCNCSICSRKGYLWIFPVPDDDFHVEQGEEAMLVGYEFGKRSMRHMFCPTCGTSVMARKHEASEGKGIGVNARTLASLDVSRLEIEDFPGAGLDPPYQPPAPAIGSQMAAETVKETKDKTADGLKVFEGNCHCGAVRFQVRTKPLEGVGVMSCNCSLCSRNSDLWIYPPSSAVSLSGADNLTAYPFLTTTSLHSFCKTCGVSVLVQVLDDKNGDNVCPINVRTINGVEIAGLKLKRFDGGAREPGYVLPEVGRRDVPEPTPA